MKVAMGLNNDPHNVPVRIDAGQSSFWHHRPLIIIIITTEDFAKMQSNNNSLTPTILYEALKEHSQQHFQFINAQELDMSLFFFVVERGESSGGQNPYV